MLLINDKYIAQITTILKSLTQHLSVTHIVLSSIYKKAQYGSRKSCKRPLVFSGV